MHTITRMLLSIVLLASLAEAKTPDGPKPGRAKQDPPPNILFIIMDDVGIDQMETFGYGAPTAPSTPNITEIADEGIRFRNAWAMPACTTSRATLYGGRFPFRNNVKGALGPDDLANSMVSPYEVTTPKLLETRGYTSAMFGKFHIALQTHDPAGIAGPHALGWDYFAGYMDDTGDPPSIDTTAGGVAPEGVSYTCGFVPGKNAGGADTGACYMPNGRCRKYGKVKNGVPPGRACRDKGGIFDPEKRCSKDTPSTLNFAKQSGHYVGPLVYNYPDGSTASMPATDKRARLYRSTVIVDEAVKWIRSRKKNEPWMASVNFTADHTPIQQPPPPKGASAADNEASSALDCTTTSGLREASNLMIESIDADIGRLLVETHLARRGEDGRIVYDPERSDTMIVLIGDNGSLGTTVKAPFSVPRAKGTAYQTGVWVPMIVAGPLVEEKNRSVPQMVNVADLYSLFGEIAGITDVRAAVARPIDAEPLLPYVLDPDQAPIREWNYTEVGVNLQAGGAINGPCTIENSCTQIPVTRGVCEDNNGTWWGRGHGDLGPDVPEEGFRYCCEVVDHVLRQGCTSGDTGCPYSITPLVSVGIRNEHYKIVQNSLKIYVSPEEVCKDQTFTEFYEVDEAVPTPNLDDDGDDLLTGPLSPEQQQNFDQLSGRLATLLASEPACPADGTLDLVVDQDDLDGWALYAAPVGSGGSSVFDLDLDGDTDLDDKTFIEAHLGADCRP